METKHKEGGENRFSGIRSIGLLTMIPTVMVAGLLVGYFFGKLADRIFKVSPWGTIVLSVLGVTAGFKQTIRLIQEAGRENKESKE